MSILTKPIIHSQLDTKSPAVQYKVQQKHSGAPQANYATLLVTIDYDNALANMKRQQRAFPSRPVRLIVETYLPEWKLAKREIRKDKRFVAP